VISGHNEIRDELSNLACKASIPLAVCDEPRINSCRPAEKKKDLEQPTPSVNRNFHNNRGEERGYLLIRGLWTRRMDCIIDVRAIDADAKSIRSKYPTKVLAAHERERNKKYLEACLAQRRHLTLCVASTDGPFGKRANILLKKLSALLADKWEKSYSQVRGYVNARMSLAIVRATHLCLRGSRIATGQMSRRPQWEEKAGLSLFRH
jgi:hypothetical protein